MTSPNLAAAIEREEGREMCAYPDPLSPLGRACAARGLKLHAYDQVPAAEATLDGAPWTIGVGHTGPSVRAGARWSDPEIDAALQRDIAHVCSGLDAAIPWWRNLGEARQDVLAQMAFQMGVAGVATFRTTLAHVQATRFADAADAMLHSAWARQTPARARRLAAQMRMGVAS